MMRRPSIVYSAIVAAVLVLVGAPAAEAQIRRVEPTQSVGFTIGYFTVRGEESRVAGDVLLANLLSTEPLAFDVSDFNGPAIGGEWLFGFGEYLEGGVGVGFSRRTVPSVYREVVSDTGREIEQDLRLRIVPISFTVRFLPIGRGHGGAEPYVGAGVGLFNWRYSEVGDFVDTFDYSIFPGRFVADGTSTGAVILGGIRFPVGGLWLVGGEARYQKAEGTIDMSDTGLIGDRIDLGGWTFNLTAHMRF